jgi:hypothetical protein
MPILKDLDDEILQYTQIVFWTLSTILGLLYHNILKIGSILVFRYEKMEKSADLMSLLINSWSLTALVDLMVVIKWHKSKF